MKNMGMGTGRRKYIDAQQRIETRRYHVRQMCHFQAVSRNQQRYMVPVTGKTTPTDERPDRSGTVSADLTAIRPFIPFFYSIIT